MDNLLKKKKKRVNPSMQKQMRMLRQIRYDDVREKLQDMTFFSIGQLTIINTYSSNYVCNANINEETSKNVLIFTESIENE